MLKGTTYQELKRNDLLFSEIEKGNIQNIQNILGTNLQFINATNNINQNILQYAINHKRSEIGNYILYLLLINKDANQFEKMIFNQDSGGNTFLHLAAKNNQLQFIKNFCENIYRKDWALKLIELPNFEPEPLTAIGLAKKESHDEMAKFLIEAKNIFKYGDDSSDEDDSVEDYDIEQSILDFKESEGFKNRSEEEQKIIPLSFITHAIGIYLLYSPQVQERYYELKQSKLNSKVTEPQLCDDQAIQKKFTEVAFNIFHYAGFDFWRKEIGSKNLMYNNINKICEEINNNKLGYFRDYMSNLIKTQNNLLNKLDNNIPNIKRNFLIPDPLKKPLDRKTLDYNQQTNYIEFDLSEVSADEFVIEFLANLRLHNRSEKRGIKNQANYQDTAWKIVDSNDSRIIVHNKPYVKEQYGGKYYSRNEQIEFLGNHQVQYKSFFSPQSQENVQLLLNNRINIKEGNIELSNNILALWYLLFGCEVIKNPASLIHHNMFLDLVEAQVLSWNDKMLDAMIHEIPMSAPSVLSKVMGLNSMYSEFMPHSYHYNKENNEATKLITREVAITKKWLEWKLGKGIAEYIVTQCAIDNNAVKAIWQLIIESLENWGFKDESFHPNSVDKITKKMGQTNLTDNKLVNGDKTAINDNILLETDEISSEISELSLEERASPISNKPLSTGAKPIPGFYANEDVDVLIKALLKEQGLTKYENYQITTIVGNNKLKLNTYILDSRSSNSTGTFVKSTDYLNSLKKDIDNILSDNKNSELQILIPVRPKYNPHWVTAQLKVAKDGKIEALIYDSLSSNTLIDNDIIYELKELYGQDKFTSIKYAEIAKIQQGTGNVYCGGYTAHLISNLIVTPAVNESNELSIWGTIDKSDKTQRQNDAKLVNQQLPDAASQFGRLGDNSETRKISIKKDETRAVEALEQFAVITNKIKDTIINLPKDLINFIAPIEKETIFEADKSHISDDSAFMNLLRQIPQESQNILNFVREDEDRSLNPDYTVEQVLYILKALYDEGRINCLEVYIEEPFQKQEENFSNAFVPNNIENHNSDDNTAGIVISKSSNDKNTVNKNISVQQEITDLLTQYQHNYWQESDCPPEISQLLGILTNVLDYSNNISPYHHDA